MCLQTDDTANAGNDIFRQPEERMSARFDCKPHEVLDNNKSIRFNGACITMEDGNYLISQPDHIQKLQGVQTNNIEKSQYIAQRARGAYIASVPRPDLSYEFAVASQVADPDRQSVEKMNCAIKHCRNPADFQLRYVSIDREST